MHTVVMAYDKVTGKLVKMMRTVDVGIVYELWCLEGYKVRTALSTILTRGV